MSSGSSSESNLDFSAYNLNSASDLASDSDTNSKCASPHVANEIEKENENIRSD